MRFRLVKKQEGSPVGKTRTAFLTVPVLRIDRTKVRLWIINNIISWAKCQEKEVQQ